MAEALGSDSALKTLISLPLPSAPMAFLHRRRRWILLFSAAAVSGYGAYRVYNLPSVARKRRKLAWLVEALVSVAEAVSSSADTIALVSSDLNRFLRSESDEIPTSLKQISKIARSDEFAASLSKVSEALTVGVVRGVGSSSKSSERASPDITDRILEKLLSASGSGFASVVVGSFARNLVIGFYASGSGQDSSSGSVPSWIHLICSDDKCRELIASCIQSFVSSAVDVYLEKTMNINAFDEFFAGITNPKHEDKVKELVSVVCNGAVETLIKTCHQVVMNPSTSSSMNGVELGQKGNESIAENDERKSFDVRDKEGGGWIHQVSSTLSVPSNRSFVLDVTGRVTFETVRSFLEFLLWKLCDGAKRSVHAVREGVVEKGVEVVRYFSAKSMLVVTICLALCMRVLAGTRVLMPA